MAAEEEARGTQGFFFCNAGSRLEEAGRKMVIYTQFCIGSKSSASSDPEGLTVRISQKYDHLEIRSFRRWLPPAGLNMGTHTIFL